MATAVGTWLLLGLGLSPAEAAVAPAAEGALRFVCSDADGTRHPKKLIVEQVVRRSSQPGSPGTALLMNYDSTQEGEPRAGVVRVAVKRVSGGSTSKLASFKAKSDPRTGEATDARAVDDVIEMGDVLLWEFRFAKFDPLRRDKCFAILVATSPLEQEPGQ